MYYALHERFTVLPTHGNDLIYYKRFIDDVFGVWNGPEANWKAFQTTLDSFGSLKWDVSPLSREAIFLDLRLKIDHQQLISTRTYQKPLNLFLYIPPRSAHPVGVLKSTIYGNLRRFHRQNTRSEDFKQVAREFAEHLVNRGHSYELVAKIFRDAAAAFDSANIKTNQPSTDDGNSLFYHAEYHPRGVPRRDIRAAYNATLAGHDNFKRLVVAYRRPRNLRDALMRTKLQEPPGHRVSDTLTHHSTNNQPTGGHLV